MLAVILLFVLITRAARGLRERRSQPGKNSCAPCASLRSGVSVYYYFVFGSFLALLMWLPHYYVSAYQLDMQTAMLLTLLFVSLSSMVGHWAAGLPIAMAAAQLTGGVFWICLVCLFFSAIRRPT